jgi:hypothetical protein
MSRAYIRRVEPFSPRNISNCSLWYDGADPAGTGVPPSVGSTVSTWIDKSGNSNNGTSGSATFLRDSLGGYINFTGSQHYSITNTNIVVNQYFTVFMVEQIGDVPLSTNYALMGGTSQSDNANLHIVYLNTNTIRFARWNNDLDASMSAYGYGTGTTQPTRLWSFSFTASSRIIFLNGTSIGSDANNTFLSSATGTSIGRVLTQNYYTGKIREVIIYSGTITTPQRQQVEGYLAQKWGLRNQLSQTHAGFINILYPVSIRPTMAPRGYFTQFSPTSIAGSVLWLDAADTTKYTLSGSNVTQIVDKSSNAYTFTGSAGSYPTQTTTLNGLPVISSAAGQYLQITSFNQNFTTATCFAVVRPTEDITPNGKLSNGYPLYVIINGVGAGAFQFGINYANQTQNPGDDSRFTVSVNKSGTGLLYGVLGGANRLTYNPINTNLLMSAVMSGSSGTNAIYLNGTSVNLYTISGTFSSMTPTLQCLGLPSGSFGYQFAETLVYGTTLTASQVQQVESYLAQKWGLAASLPGSHLNTTQPVGYPTPGTALKRSMVPLDIPIVATGGTTSIINGRKYHYFLSDGTFTINTTASVEIFLIGGGAGGSSGTYTCAGGGAGGLVLQTINLRSGSYAITVGQGGGSGSSGGNSVMAGVATAFGGGTGNTSGGCGGGQTVNGGGPGAGSQGFAGGPAQGGSYNGYNNFNGGGGGGVRGAGGIGGGYTIEGLPNTSSGGMGITYSDGSSYGGGGSGGSIASGTPSAANGFGGGAGAFWSGSPSAGTNGTGGGGGGGSQNSGGASGGNGIVILSYIPIP